MGTLGLRLISTHPEIIRLIQARDKEDVHVSAEGVMNSVVNYWYLLLCFAEATSALSEDEFSLSFSILKHAHAKLKSKFKFSTLSFCDSEAVRAANWDTKCSFPEETNSAGMQFLP